jgi:hypothetical protein
MVCIHIEEHNIHMTYITLILQVIPMRLTLHMLREHIHVLRKGPQDIIRSPRPRCMVVASCTTDTQPLPHDRDCPQAISS